MDDPNITMEEYLRLEEEKARKCAIVFNDTLTSEVAFSCEPTVSSLNDDEIDFRISFDESDDADYTVIFDKNSFSYKIISVNDLKMHLENDNEKVNMPSFPTPELTVSYFDDLDFFKDFKNEFPAIVYKDAQTPKSELLTEPILSPQHIDEFNLKDETSLSECDEEEQNVLNFNDLFPFNVIYPNNSKSDKDNDDDKVDIEHSSGDLYVKPLPDVINNDVGAYAQGSEQSYVSIPSLRVRVWSLSPSWNIAIVFDNTLTSKVTPSYEPTVSPLNDNKIYFRISFDESDDEDYTVIYDENSFSYKIVYVDNLKEDSENDNDKVNMPSFLSPELEVKIDDPNITIKEYIRLEEEKARRYGKVYNWETATYGKI
nr:hypothetical protein [Tanacetum cinerariifolium]